MYKRQVRDFTDMRCKHSRVLSVIRERLHRCLLYTSHVPSQELQEPSGTERALSNRPDGYKTMGVAGEATEHPSDLTDRKSTRLNSSHITRSRMPSSA